MGRSRRDALGEEAHRGHSGRAFLLSVFTFELAFGTEGIRLRVSEPEGTRQFIREHASLR